MNVQGGSVENKVKKATEYLLEAGALFGSMSTDEVLRSELHLHAMERYFQLIVDAVLDINGHLIKELDLEPAEDLKGTFEIPSDSDVLKKDFSEKISRVVGLRSLIVHQYEKVDNRKFLEDFRENNGDFDEHFLGYLGFSGKEPYSRQSARFTFCRLFSLLFPSGV